ncbi:MAG TPA: preprotein translocase subunit SecG [Verrucomicrobiae bacterium]|nr:preprotein translocase subunit SecG [Verrucomicrobiae bacterium]
MNIVIFLLTAVLVVDCLFLGLLILVQLPKKEAGVGMAFGGGATDALFGAGSGNALTKLTKYSAIVFFCLVFILSVLNVQAKKAATSAADLRRQLSKPESAPIAAPGAPAAATNANPVVSTNLPPASNNILNLVPPTIPATNTAAPGTNPPAAPGK